MKLHTSLTDWQNHLLDYNSIIKKIKLQKLRVKQLPEQYKNFGTLVMEEYVVLFPEKLYLLLNLLYKSIENVLDDHKSILQWTFLYCNLYITTPT